MCVFLHFALCISSIYSLHFTHVFLASCLIRAPCASNTALCAVFTFHALCLHFLHLDSYMHRVHLTMHCAQVLHFMHLAFAFLFFSFLFPKGGCVGVNKRLC
jgi:hypothetical protein